MLNFSQQIDDEIASKCSQQVLKLAEKFRSRAEAAKEHMLRPPTPEDSDHSDKEEKGKKEIGKEDSFKFMYIYAVPISRVSVFPGL